MSGIDHHRGKDSRMCLSDVQFVELIKFLSNQEKIRRSNAGLEGLSWGEIADQIVPELTETQQVLLEEGVWETFMSRAQSDLPPKIIIAEVFLRGAEFGRELERRTR